MASASIETPTSLHVAQDEDSVATTGDSARTLSREAVLRARFLFADLQVTTEMSKMDGTKFQAEYAAKWKLSSVDGRCFDQGTLSEVARLFIGLHNKQAMDKDSKIKVKNCNSRASYKTLLLDFILTANIRAYLKKSEAELAQIMATVDKLTTGAISPTEAELLQARQNR